MLWLSKLFMGLNIRLKANLMNNKFEFWKCFSNQSSNYYSILGLKPLATDDEIKQAYYDLSKQYHPDKNMGNETATSKILEINEAFEVLGNKEKREQYNEKNFPKASVKKTHFIYEHSEYYDPPEFQRKIFRKPVAHYPYEQFLKHCKGEKKRKHRHSFSRLNFNKDMGTKFQLKVIR